MFIHSQTHEIITHNHTTLSILHLLVSSIKQRFQTDIEAIIIVIFSLSACQLNNYHRMVHGGYGDKDSSGAVLLIPKIRDGISEINRSCIYIYIYIYIYREREREMWRLWYNGFLRRKWTR